MGPSTIVAVASPSASAHVGAMTVAEARSWSMGYPVRGSMTWLTTRLPTRRTLR